MTALHSDSSSSNPRCCCWMNLKQLLGQDPTESKPFLEKSKNCLHFNSPPIYLLCISALLATYLSAAASCPSPILAPALPATSHSNTLLVGAFYRSPLSQCKAFFAYQAGLFFCAGHGFRSPLIPHSGLYFVEKKTHPAHERLVCERSWLEWSFCAGAEGILFHTLTRSFGEWRPWLVHKRRP